MCESALANKLSLYIFLYGLWKRSNIKVKDIHRLYSAIILINRLITGPSNPFFTKFRSIVESELVKCEKLLFRIDSFQTFLMHLKLDINTAEKVIYSIIHNVSFRNLLTNPYQFETKPKFDSIARSSDNKRIARAKKLYSTKKLQFSQSDLFICQRKSKLYNLPIEMIVAIADYLPSGDKVAYMMTCRKFFYIGNIFFPLTHEKWEDIKKPACSSFKTFKQESGIMNECTCLCCLVFCPCEIKDFADIVYLKKFLISTAVFNTFHILTPQDLTVFSKYLKYVPRQTKVNFPITLIDLQKLFVQEEFQSLEYTFETNSRLYHVNESELETFFNFPFVKQLSLVFTQSLSGTLTSEQVQVFSTLVRSHLEKFEMHTFTEHNLETLRLTQCKVMTEIFVPAVFHDNLTWFRTLRILDFSECLLNCKVLNYLRNMNSLEFLYLNNIEVQRSCASNHFKRHLRSDFFNLLQEQDGLYVPFRFPPLQILADSALLCNCQNIAISPANFEQYSRQRFTIPICFDCTLDFGCV